MKSKRIYPVWIVVALIVILLAGGYMVSYYALLNRDWAIQGEGAWDKHGSFSRTRRYASYGNYTAFDEAFFLPAHWIDRQIRPDYWRWYAEGEPGAP